MSRFQTSEFGSQSHLRGRVPEIEMLTSLDMARVLRMSRKTVLELTAAGTIKSIKLRGVYRYHPLELDRLLSDALGAGGEPSTMSPALDHARPQRVCEAPSTRRGRRAV